MRDIYVADVGDGLCMAIYTISGGVVQIDCGGQKAKTAFNGLRRILDHLHSPDVFVLSHFHIDHYRGLLHASINTQRHPSFRIRRVYYPRIPEFKDKREFLYELFTMNMRVFGSETGVMEYDLLKAVSRMNNGMPFKYEPLSKGDLINLNGSIFKIIWPPPAVDHDRTLAQIRQALDDFRRALEEDEITRHLYERVREEGVFEEYFGQETEESWYREYDNRYRRPDLPIGRIRLPDAVKKANASLRKAANHLSLALFEDNRLLFLGDTQNYEIKQIVDDLKARGRKNFYVFILPHHGTQWHNGLRQIRCIYSIASNGSKLCSKMKPHFKEISERPLATFVNGDIMVPDYRIREFWRTLPWFYGDI